MRLVQLGFVLALGSAPPSPSTTWTAGAGAGGTALGPGPIAQERSESPAVARFSRERALLDEAAAALEGFDYALARTKAAEAVDALLAQPESEQGGAWLSLLGSAARSAWSARDPQASESAWQRVLDVRSRTLPDDHPDVQVARLNLGETLYQLGDLAGARALFEKVLETFSRTLSDDHPDVQAARLNLGGTLYRLGDLPGARALFERVLEVRSRTLPDDHPDLQRVRQNLAATIAELGDLAGARALEEEVLEVFSRTLPDDHPDLQRARQNLAATTWQLGDLPGARALFEKVLEVFSRTLPDDHPDLQSARGNLAVTIKELGDLAGARALFERVLEVLSRTLPDDHPGLQAARQNLAATIKELGDLAGARALEEKVLEIRSRTLPEDHHDLQSARQNLAATIGALGDLAGARALEEKALEVFSRTLPDDHPDLQMARLNLAVTIVKLGDLAGARALQEKALEVCLRTLPDDHPGLQGARQSLASTIKELGDLAGARTLEEKVLEVFSRTLPDDHPDLQNARSNLAVTLTALGDFAGARALLERVLEVRSRALPDDHPDLQAARLNLGGALFRLGDFAVAGALFEKVLEVFSRTLPDDHPDLLLARLDLGWTLYQVGDFAGARELFEGVFEVRSAALPHDHPDLQAARQGLAAAIRALGDLAGARELLEEALEVFSRTLPDDHPDLQAARGNLAVTISLQAACAGLGGERIQREAERKQCADLIAAECSAGARAAREAILTSSSREAEERCWSMTQWLEASLSVAQGYGVLEPLREIEPAVFAFSETTRGAELRSAEIRRRAAHSPEYEVLRSELQRASAELAEVALREGTTSEEFDRVRSRRDAAGQALVAASKELSGGEPSADIDLETLSPALGEREAWVGFRRYREWKVGVGPDLDATGHAAVHETSVEALCAFVVHRASSEPRSDGSHAELELVDLGPVDAVERAVHEWRAGVGVGQGRGSGVAATPSTTDLRARGDALRRLVFDPLRPALQGADRVVLALDDVLHLVPFDALPADAGGDALLGDRWRIETRATLWELADHHPELDGVGEWLGIGDVSYDGTESESQVIAAAMASGAGSKSVEIAGILRGGSWSGGFPALASTRAEVDGIAQSFADAWGEGTGRHLLEGAGASKGRLLELAPRARFLHIATHGWFAPESIRSWSDPEPIDRQSGLGLRMSGEEQVRGMSPMLLCGLALAGANLPEDALGRAPGLITAEEIAAIDLSSCELAVLSACDTNVGERRAGQGVASLQKALQMAGTRSVITSLWKVPDEATKELMIEFYRRLWVEREPKWRALWEAKMRLRDAKDERGEPKYVLRDWAAWVLTGEPE